MVRLITPVLRIERCDIAGEIKVRGPQTGSTLYYRILGSGNSVWSTSGGTGGFESYNSADWADYVVSLTEQGSTLIYVGNIPSAVPAGVYDVDARKQVAGSPAVTDTNIGTGEVQWNGSKVLPLSDLATSGQLGMIGPLRVGRGTQIKNWPVYLKSSTDHVTPLVSGVVSGQIARDGGAFGPLQSGAFLETGLGWYSLQALTSGDLLADTIKLHFSAVGISGGSADPVPMALITQRVSGY